MALSTGLGTDTGLSADPNDQAASGLGAIPQAIASVDPTQYVPQPVASFFDAGSTDNTPIQSNAASNQQALIKKYTDIGSQVNALPPQLRNALIDYDTKRVAAGSSPISKPQTLAALAAIASGKSPAQPHRSILDLPGNVLDDLKSVILSVPRLFDPRTWIHEASQIPNIPEAISKNSAAGMDPLQSIANAPGIRMIPGSFLAGNILHPTELLRHPLFSALDALPAAEALAKTTPIAREAARLAEEAGTDARPLATVLTKRFDDTGAIVPNRVGDLVQAVKESRLGRLGTEAFGNRDVFRKAEQENRRIVDVQKGVVEPSNEMERLARQAVVVEDKYGIPEARRIELTRSAELGDRSSWTPDELAYMNAKREVTDGFARLNESDGMLGSVLSPSTGRYEFYPKETADAIKNERATRAIGAQSSADIAKLREEYLRPTGKLTADDFSSSIDSAIGYGKPSVTNTAVRATIHTLDAYGYDVAPLKSAVHLVEKNHQPWDVFAKKYADWDATHGPASAASTPRMGAVDIIDELNRHGQHTQGKILAAALADKNTPRITKALDNILSQTNSRLPIADVPGFAESVRSLRERYRFENSTGYKFTDRLAERRAAKAAEADSIMPAPDRFQRLIEHNTVKRVAERFTPQDASPEQAAMVVQALNEKRWGSLPPEAKDIYSGIEGEVRDNWQALAEAGADPQFVHRVSRSRANSVESPRVGPVPVSLSQTKARLTDFSPGIDDVAVSVSHQGVEMLQRQGTENLIDYVLQKSGKREADLIEQFAPGARDAGRSANFEQQLQDIMGKNWRRFDPAKEGYNWNSAKLDKYNQDTYWIPEPLARQLESMNKGKGPFSAAIDPITNTFRMSVVGLSPRTHFYNILGGLAMTLGQTGPSVFKYWKQAREMVKDASTIESDALRATIGGEKRALFDANISRAEAENSFRFGKTIRRLTDENSLLGKVAGKSMDLNGMFDDQYRVMSYLYGHDKALTKGLSEDVARRAGETLMEKTMMDWAGATPMERNLFRSVFPFYGFMRHAIKYVARYPVDHPLRAAVLGAFGKSEAADLGLLPLSFLGSVAMPFVGDGGNRRLNLGPINPFADAANMFTVAGFLGATNPVINTALDTVGVDRGSAELYPTLRYDPTTGRMMAVHENPILAFLQNTIPQSQIITAFTGLNDKFNTQAAKDPAGANRSLLSAAGFPTLWRQQNLDTERLKAELARQSAYSAVKNAAFKSGDYSEAQAYPQFKTDLEKYLALPQAERDKMIPRGQQPLFQGITQVLANAGRVAPDSSAATNTGGI